MREIKVALFAIFACLMLVFAVPGCKKTPKKDPKAAEACKTAGKKDSDTCKACCKAAGMGGHMWMLGKGCKCL